MNAKWKALKLLQSVSRVALYERASLCFHQSALPFPLHRKLNEVNLSSLQNRSGSTEVHRGMSCNSKSQKPKTTLVAAKESRRFMKDCFLKVNVTDQNADMMAEMLVFADMAGHYSHGMNRLEMYLRHIEKKMINGQASIKILKETDATAWVDGCNGLGAVIGINCMKMAIQKALKSGISWVAVKNSNHYGIQQYYVKMAINKGLIGFTTTNTTPLMVPTGGRQALLGTNPLAFGAPAECDDNFVLDMATTVVAMGKIELQLRKGEPLPSGWALDKEGKPTTDAKKAFEAKLLMPLGGEAKNSGYKGAGLSAMVDILSGVLAGSNFLNKVKSQASRTNEPFNIGHSFMVLNPKHFAPNFEERQSEFNCILRNCKPVDPKKPLMLPGDVETARFKNVAADGGLRYSENQIKACAALAKKLGVKPLETLRK